MNNLLIQFGMNVRSRRKLLGISQERLALLAGLDRSYMGRVERGEVNLTIEKLYLIARVLDCHPRDLLP
uniref:helix-turn-helix domain-containing protein n=1 Tax=Marinobacterium profundum TaxID=1714300 RepID=UPI0009EA82EA|nr:helix-turn-helix transcriptional regulator [Marinobacterium profundum]